MTQEDPGFRNPQPTPFHTLDDVCAWGTTQNLLGFTYRSFEVVDLGNRQCSVRLGSWNPIVRLFRPHGQLLLSEEAARLLVDQLQDYLKGLAQHDADPWYQRIIEALRPKPSTNEDG